MADNKPKKKVKKCRIPESLVKTYLFRLHPYFAPRRKIIKREVPIRCIASSDTLTELAGNAVRLLPLPVAFRWTNIEVMQWIASIGFPEYRNTMYQNYISGHTLLYLDASALSSLNIKKFHHIKKIAKAIRELYSIEFVRYIRSISLPPRKPWTHFLFYKGFTGPKYEVFTPMDLYRKMKMIRPPPNYATHWMELEIWLQHKQRPEWDIIGYTYKRNLYKAKKKPLDLVKQEGKTDHTLINCKICCPPPCDYFNKDYMMRPTRRLSYLQKRIPTNRDKIFDLALKLNKKVCLLGRHCCPICDCRPICTCMWGRIELSTPKKLTILTIGFDTTYDHVDL